MGHFKLVFGSGTSRPAKIRPLKVGPPAIKWKSSLYENFHLPSGLVLYEEGRAFSSPDQNSKLPETMNSKQKSRLNLVKVQR